jgi:uncharacterized protein YrrD
VLSLRGVYRLEVYSAKGKRIGRVEDVLFAPSGSTVVGFVVTRPRLLFLVDLKDRYLSLDRVTITSEGLTVAAGRDAWDATAAKRLGFSWDDSVIWMGMPVRTRGGIKLGSVRDGLFDPASGKLSALGLTAGATADMAVGVRDISASLVEGFDGAAVVVADEVAATETSGGAAAAAGKGAAVGAKVVGEAAKTAALYGKAAARVASQSETGKKAMGWLKSMKDTVVDAMGEPDDE